MAKEFLREVANELNRFDSNIEKLRTWSEVYEGYDDEEKMCLMMEFIEPLAIVAFNQPTTLRARFIYSLSHTSHQANRWKVQGWKETNLPKDVSINYKTMKTSSKPWPVFAGFSKSFDYLDNEEWKSITKGFRNKYHHQIPPWFEVGHTQIVTRTLRNDRTASYGFGACEPLPIKDYLDDLRGQHTCARTCFDAYSQLLADQWSGFNES
jgi:hypothetical protein